jgi:hypothetical protein
MVLYKIDIRLWVNDCNNVCKKFVGGNLFIKSNI